MHDTRFLCGLIGAGIQRSLTPALQETEAHAQGLRLHYQTIDLDKVDGGAQALPALVEAANAMGFAGLNITYPCKQAVLPLLHELSDEARAIGAVNTVLFDARRAIGHNTDGSGWRWGFERALPDADLSRVALLGAGGAGSAIAHALCGMRATALVLVDINQPRARALAADLQRAYPYTRTTVAVGAAEALRDATGLVHATPTGMGNQPDTPLDTSLLRPQLWLSEVVYLPLETPLLRAAQACGCTTVDGGTMAIGQAVGAFELFTGRPADAARMASHFHRLVSAREL